MSIPATLLTCVVQPVMGAKRLNLLGFGLQAALFATFAVLYGLEQQDTQVPSRKQFAGRNRRYIYNFNGVQ